MLADFREWLVVRPDHGNNLTWPALVRHLAPNGFVHPLTPEADSAAVGALFQLLDEFLELREGRDGPLKIYGAYQARPARPQRWPTDARCHCYPWEVGVFFRVPLRDGSRF